MLTFPNSTVPVSLLFSYLAQGKTYKEFVEIYSKDVTESDALAAIEAAQTNLCPEEFHIWQELISLRGEIERLSHNTSAAFKQLAEIIEG